ncbi:MAG: NAD(P)-dependent oxidoreductase [Ignavibacteriaceae bacterium]|jgi:nucleoside-diphosphate-sugar epimerase
MKILVTGGAGYIGSILTEKLLQNNYRVTVIDNFMYNQDSLLHLCHNQNLDIIRGDVRNNDFLISLIKKHDVLIPLAAIVGAPLCDKLPIEAKQINSDVIKIIAENKSPNQILIFPNTNSGYGISDITKPCTEDSPLNPISHYGKTKVEAENYIKNSIDGWIIFRLATVFGASPKMRLDLLVNDFTHRAWRDGFIVLYEKNFKRNYVYIRDVSDAFIWAIENFDKVKNNIFNFGLSNANLTKLELCNKIKDHVDHFEVSIAEINKDVDLRNYIVSNAKIEKFGFKAATNIDFGIKELLKAFSVMSNSKYSNI